MATNSALLLQGRARVLLSADCESRACSVPVERAATDSALWLMSLTAVLGRARCSSAPTVESALAGSLLVATQRTIGSSALAGFLFKGLLLIVRWAAVNGSHGCAGPGQVLVSPVHARCSSALSREHGYRAVLGR